MHQHISRRNFITAATVAATTGASPAILTPSRDRGWTWGLPIGLPGRVPGDGFFIRHGFATENTWYFPGAWHAGEDYYVLEGSTAGAEVYAVADGEVVYAAFDYPGRVVIIRHADDLYSMYGHLDPDLTVTAGSVARGQLLGTVVRRTDGRAPDHLHFEIRRFFTTPEVNGRDPRYGFVCGPDCPPGPGYWPMDAPEHPAQMGWLNPLHAIAQRAFPDGPPSSDARVTAAVGADRTVHLMPIPDDDASPIGELRAVAGERFRLRALDAGEDDTMETSAEAYRLWYQIEAPGQDEPAWVRAVEPMTDETGSDGRPSSIRFLFLPDVRAQLTGEG